MNLFGKKNEEDIDEDEEQELKGSRVDRKLIRKINKDLEPQNRKKRKEPPRPWGKKERIIVLFIFISSILVSGILALSARGYGKLDLQNINLSLPDFSSLNILKEETIMIERKK